MVVAKQDRQRSVWSPNLIAVDFIPMITSSYLSWCEILISIYFLHFFIIYLVGIDCVIDHCPAYSSTIQRKNNWPITCSLHTRPTNQSSAELKSLIFSNTTPSAPNFGRFLPRILPQPSISWKDRLTSRRPLMGECPHRPHYFRPCPSLRRKLCENPKSF